MPLPKKHTKKTYEKDMRGKTCIVCRCHLLIKNAYNIQIRKAAPLYSKKRQPVLSLMMGKQDLGYDPPAPHWKDRHIS